MPGETGPIDTTVNPSTATAPVGFTPEQLQQIVAALVPEVMKGVSPGLNTAITQRFERFEKNHVPQAPAPQAPNAEQPKTVNTSNPELAALQMQLQELRKGVEERDQQIKATRQEQLRRVALSELEHQLEVNSVRPEQRTILARYLEAEGRLKIGENGQPSFIIKRSAWEGGPEEEVAVTLEEGVRQYVKSDSVAKSFIAAPIPEQVKPDTASLAMRAAQARAQGRSVAFSGAEKAAIENEIAVRLGALGVN